MPVQEINNEMLELLAAKLQRRYEPNFAWVNSVSAYNNLPVVRGHWPLSINFRTDAGLSYTGNMADASFGANSIYLSLINNPLYRLDGLVHSIEFNGANNYLTSNIVDRRLDIIGNETYVHSDITGITAGCWFRPASIAGTQTLISRLDVGGQQVFRLYKQIAGNLLLASIFVAGGVGLAQGWSTSAVRNEVWQFGAFSYWTDGVDGYGNVYLSTGTGVLEMTPFTTLGVTTVVSANLVPLRVAMTGPGWDYFNGRISNVFLCASRCSEVAIRTLFHQTRALYGV